MTSAKPQSKPKRKLSPWLIFGGVMVLILIAVFAGRPLLQQMGVLPTVSNPNDPANIPTGQVVALTAITSVNASGSIEAQQVASVNWEVAGQVLTVAVRPGDSVTRDQILMYLDPATAPQSVVQAQVDLVNAQNALDDLLNPTALQLANAQKAVADAQSTLEAAQTSLDKLTPTDLSYYEEQVTKKQQALTVAEQDALKTNIGNLATALENAKTDLENKTNQLNDAVSAQAQCPDCTTIFVNAAGRKMTLEQAQDAYTAASNNYQIAEINYNQALTNSTNSVATAQDALADAVANLKYAQLPPDAIELAQAQAKVAVAEATLTDAQTKLITLQTNPDPADVQAAQVRVLVAQATLNKLALRAPFDGEVLRVNYQPGDMAAPSQVAVIIANRTQLHVNVSVDESDIGQIAAGQPVSITFDSLPDVELAGTVTSIDPIGQTTQGLVRYTVRVEATSADAHVLLGMTANVEIVTNVQTGALAVPLDAVQLDDVGEYVNRVNLLGGVERVEVVSGEVQEEFVLVAGALQPGDSVQLIVPQPANAFGGPFGGGGGRP